MGATTTGRRLQKRSTYVEHHLVEKAKETDRHGQPITEQWLAAVKQHLYRAVDHFGGARLLGSITRADLLTWLSALARRFRGGAARPPLHPPSNLCVRGGAGRRP